MTPYEINLLLHYYTTPAAPPAEEQRLPLWTQTIDAFMGERLIEPRATCPPPDLDYKPAGYTVTEKGRFYIKALMGVPLPVQEWRIPVPTWADAFGLDQEQDK